MSFDAKLPPVPIHDYRDRSMLEFVRDHRSEALDLMNSVIGGLGALGAMLRPVLPFADQIADRRLVAMKDPYRDELCEIRDFLGQAGPLAFNLSYEFGCTARAFETGGTPLLFRTLDWPFRGLGERVRIVHLPGEAGNWSVATWPGVVGCLQVSAPGRFAAALNQAPERASRYGRAAAWVGSKRAFLKATGLPPAHLLRKVAEIAPDFATARRMLTETPLAAPVIYTVTGTKPGEASTIERTETKAREAQAPAAANHFSTELSEQLLWRPRGHDSEGRRSAAINAPSPPQLAALEPPILNPLTRLAVSMDANGHMAVMGYDADSPVTALTQITGDA